MRNKGQFINKKVHIGWVLLIITGMVASGMAVKVAAEPGDATDPLVSQSYVDGKIGELNTKIAALTTMVNTLSTTVTNQSKTISSLSTEVSALKSQVSGLESPKFTVIELLPGQSVMLGASTEFILRGGKATAISGTYGGLSDLTSGSGQDLIAGASVPLNHLILASREDGRGIKIIGTADQKAYLLIKGAYTLK